MDVGKNRLATLPSDILAIIVVSFSGEQLFRLKSTGSKFLWHKLIAIHTVKSISLGKDLCCFKTWPAFLNDFPSLIELSIHSKHYNWFQECKPKLSFMPPTLRKLEIHVKELDLADFFQETEGKTVSFQNQVPLLDAIHIPLRIVGDYAWVGRLSSSLTSLHIWEWSGNVPLPPSLIHLKATSRIVFLPPIKVQLPPTLETITAQKIDGLDLLLSQLPPKFRELSTPSWIAFPYKGVAKSLPSTMTIMPPISINGNDVSSSSSAAAFLPPSLKSIYIVNFRHEVWQHLPSSLEKIILKLGDVTAPIHIKNPSTGNTQEFSSYPLHLLPISISDMSLMPASHKPILLEACDPSDLTQPLLFHPSLTRLYLVNVQLSLNAVKHLPSTLTQLSIDSICEALCQHLPRGLKHLDGGRAMVSPNFFKLLPKSLLSLSLVCAPSTGSFFDANGSYRPISDLPGFLVRKEYGNNLTWRVDESLPSTLTSLKLQQFSDICDSFMQQNLANLQTLHFTFSTKLTDLAIPLITRSLTSLSLSSELITGNCFPSLPRGLVQLELSTSNIHDSDILQLPRTMESVSLANALHLTNACIENFPKYLRTLSLKNNQKITSETFSKMPYFIRHSSCEPTAFVAASWMVNFGHIINTSSP